MCICNTIIVFTFVFQIVMAYINSPLFLEKGKALSSHDINRLISKRTVSRRDVIQDSGNTTPMCTAVIECDPGSGHVSGSRWFVSGMLPTEIKIKSSRLYKESGATDAYLKLKLPLLDNFTFSGSSTSRNLSNWLSSDYIMEHGSLMACSKSTAREARDREAMEAVIPGFSNGLSIRLMLLPKQVGNIILSVLVTPMDEDRLRSACAKFGREMGAPCVPALKPCLSGRHNSVMIAYRQVEPSGKSWGIAHVPHIELFSGEDMEPTLPTSKEIVQELFSLHQSCAYAKAFGGCIEQALEDAWADAPVPYPEGALKWPNAPQEISSETAESEGLESVDGDSDCPSDVELLDDSFFGGVASGPSGMSGIAPAPGVSASDFSSKAVSVSDTIPSNTEFMNFIKLQSKTMEEQGEFMKKLFETASDASRKRKSEDDDDKDEGPALVDATFRVYDDAHKKISWDIREKLRPINR